MLRRSILPNWKIIWKAEMRHVLEEAMVQEIPAAPSDWPDLLNQWEDVQELV